MAESLTPRRALRRCKEGEAQRLTAGLEDMERESSAKAVLGYRWEADS